MPISVRIIGIVKDKWTVELEFEAERIEELKEFLIKNPRVMWLLEEMLPPEGVIEYEPASPKEEEKPQTEAETQT